jgi:mono/diheme cytochrome c family protein
MPSEPTNAASPTVAERLVTIAALKGNAPAGQIVYTTASAPKCVACHAADGNGGKAGPSLLEPSMNDGVEELAAYVLNGTDMGMPKQTELSDQQIADLVAFMQKSFGNKAQ